MKNALITEIFNNAAQEYKVDCLSVVGRNGQKRRVFILKKKKKWRKKNSGDFKSNDVIETEQVTQCIVLENYLMVTMVTGLDGENRANK